MATQDKMERLMAERAAIDGALRQFLWDFEGVFHQDSDFARTAIQNDPSGLLIDHDGTFLEPGVEDEANNWANRGNLLASYRALKEATGLSSWPPNPPFKDG